jgi:HPt (histidine-containing phosphotransfer) domain-containing protein
MADTRLEMIRVEIDQELLSEVPAYLECRREDCAEIGRLLADGSMEVITYLGHQMHGSGGSFGFDEISEVGESLEHAGRVRDAVAITSAVDRLERYLERVVVIYV